MCDFYYLIDYILSDFLFTFALNIRGFSGCFATHSHRKTLILKCSNRPKIVWEQ